MLVMLNLTGLSRTYWIPVFDGAWDNRRLWYFTARWFQAELTVHGQDMGAELIRRFNRELHEIAAEPELLEALVAARKAMTNERSLKPRIGMERECAMADAAILKASGGSDA